MGARVHVESHERSSHDRCPFCHGDLHARAAVWACPGCGTRHHRDCARENGACTILGCRRSFSGAGVAPPRPVRMLPRGEPRADFRIGLVLTAIGGAGLVFELTLGGRDPSLGIPTVPFLPVGLLTVLYALYRAVAERRWRD